MAWARRLLYAAIEAGEGRLIWHLRPNELNSIIKHCYVGQFEKKKKRIQALSEKNGNGEKKLREKKISASFCALAWP